MPAVDERVTVMPATTSCWRLVHPCRTRTADAQVELEGIDTFDDSLLEYRLQAQDLAFAGASFQLESLTKLQADWDGQGAQAPNRAALQAGRRILQALQKTNLVPERVLPSVEGGVGFVFVSGSDYADIECTNEGEVLWTCSPLHDKSEIWETPPQASEMKLMESIGRIHDFLAGQKESATAESSTYHIYVQP